MIKKSINKDNLIMFFILFFCFEPKLAVKNSYFNIIYILGAILSFIVIFLKYIKKYKASLFFYGLVLFRLSFFLQTLINHGDLLMWGYMSLVLMTLCMAFEHYLKYKPILFLNCIIIILNFLLIINFIISLFYPLGIIDAIFFIGIRTRISDVIFPLLAITLIRDALMKIRISKQTFWSILTSLLNVVKFRVTTTIIGLICFATLYLIFVKRKRLRKLLNLRVIVYAGIIISFLFTFFNFSSLFSSILVNVFHKDASLSYRTQIWAESIKYLAKSPIIGQGLADNGNFIYWGYVNAPKSLWQAHNNWLQLLYDGGIVSMLIFISIINMNSVKLSRYYNKKIVSILLISMIVLFIVMISEILIYTPYFYLIIFVISNINYLVEKPRGMYEKS